MKTIAIGLLGIVLAQGNAAAQTVQEQTQIIRVFQDYVADYSGRQHCLDLSHAAMTASTPAPRIFTPPVATVFRQLIARTLNQPAHATAMRATTPSLPLEHHPVVFEPFPTNEFYDLPEVLANALPVLPAGIEYRLVKNGRRAWLHEQPQPWMRVASGARRDWLAICNYRKHEI